MVKWTDLYDVSEHAKNHCHVAWLHQNVHT